MREKMNFGLPNLTKPKNKNKNKYQKHNKISQHFYNTSILNCGGSQYLLSSLDL